jgi:peptide/nickel transport system substrate-binding protein
MVTGKISVRVCSSMLVAALLLGACAPAPTPTAVPTAVPTKAASAASPTPVPPTPTAAPKPAGKITVAVSGEPKSLDPTTEVGSSMTSEVVRNWAEPLVGRVKNSSELKPGLAEKWEQTQPTIWRFYLRKGAKFTSGKPVTSADVVWSVKRSIDPTVGSTGLTYLATLTNAVAIDDYTVDIITTAPDGMLPTRMWYAPIVEQADPQVLAVKPVGSGPYKVAEWAKGQYLRLTANEEYWGGAPKIQEINIVFRPESSVRAAMVKTGEADLAYALSPEDAKAVPKAVTARSLEFPFIRINTFHPVLKDVRVRQALAYAIDYDAILQKLYGGFASPAYGAQIVTPLVNGFNPDIKQYPYDPEKAKQLIKEAGAQGTKLTVLTQTGFYARVAELGEFLVESWRSIGLDVSLQFVDAAGWRDRLYAVKPEQNPIDIALGKHDNDTGDSFKSADSYLTCGGRLSTVCDEQMSDLAKKAAASLGEERTRLYQQMWARAQEIVPWIGIVNVDYIWAWSDRLQWQDPPVDTKINFTEMSLK